MISHRSKFINGCKENNISESIAKEIFDQMQEFSGYGFNKSHSAPYSLIAYLCAYIKANYPQEFFASAVTLEIDDDEKIIKYIYSMRKMDIELLGPNVLKSQVGFSIEGYSLRFGLKGIKNVGANLAESIFTSNEEKSYRDIYDFVSRNYKYLNKRSWEYLVKSGALDNFSKSRKELLISLDTILKQEEILDTLEEDLFEKFLMEKDAFGFFIFNPLKNIRSDLKEFGCNPINDLGNNNKHSTIIAGEIIEIKRKRNLYSGKNYAFIELGDETGIIGVTIFSSLLEKENSNLKKGELFIMEVAIERIGTFCKLIARRIMLLNNFLENQKNSHITIEINSYDQITSLKKVIEKHPGEKEIKVITDREEIFLPLGVKDSINVRLALKQASS